MLKQLLAVAFATLSIASYGQANRQTSRLFVSQAVPRDLSPDNLLYVDTQDPTKKLWPAKISSIRFKTTNIIGLKDSINTAIARAGASPSMVSWNNVVDKPVVPVMPHNVSAFANDVGYLSAVPAQTWESITGKPNMAAVSTSGSYNDLSNKPAIPAAQVQPDWSAVSGMGVILNKPVIPTIPANISAFNNDAGYLTQVPMVTWSEISGRPSFAPISTSGSWNDLLNKPTIPAAQVNADWSASSGVTMILNKPVIPTALSSLTNDVGFITSVPPQSWASITGKPTIAAQNVYNAGTGLIKSGSEPNATFSVDPALYMTNSTAADSIGKMNSNIAGKADKITTLSINGVSQNLSGNRTWTIPVPSNTSQISESGNLYFTQARARTSISAGTGIIYDNTTGVISATSTPTTPSYNNAPARPVNGTSFQISTTRATIVSYSVTHTIALTLVLSSGSSTVFLETSANGTTWTTLSAAGYSDGVTVAVALTKSVVNNVQAVIPAGNFVRLRTVTTGGGSASFTAGQEVQL